MKGNMKLETKLKKWSLSKWKKEFWKVFAKYIKARDNYKCVTCGAKVEGSNAHAGHYRTGATCNLDLYFDERNVSCQCMRCNVHLSGNWRQYQKYMHHKYGKDIDKEFDKINQGIPKWDKKDYADKIEEYKEKLSTQ